jgi:7-cyano-7-deazaguanine tRNA-ribosyltransferase
LDHAEQLEREDHVSKDAFFYLSTESARRPEVRRHHARLDRLPVAGEVLLTEGKGGADAYDHVWRVLPPFGPFPRELSDAYPFTAETPTRVDGAAQAMAARGVARLVDCNPDADFTLAHDDWDAAALERVPETVTLRNRRAER